MLKEPSENFNKEIVTIKYNIKTIRVPVESKKYNKWNEEYTTENQQIRWNKTESAIWKTTYQKTVNWNNKKNLKLG